MGLNDGNNYVDEIVTTIEQHVKTAEGHTARPREITARELLTAFKINPPPQPNQSNDRYEDTFFSMYFHGDDVDARDFESKKEAFSNELFELHQNIHRSFGFSVD